MAGFFYPAPYLDDFRTLNDETFTDTCNLFPKIVAVNNRGNEAETFGSTVMNVPCRKDGFDNRLLPQREKDNIDVDKIMSTFYIPNTYTVNIQDELESSAGNADGNILRYLILDVDRETDEVDLALLVEVVQNGDTP